MSNGTEKQAHAFDGAEKLAFLMLALLLIWPYAVGLGTRAMGYMNDDAIYVVTAKALAEGRGYNIISLPQIIPQTKYPILLPLVMAAAWKLDPHFPGNVWLLRVVPFLWALAWFALCYLLIRQEAGSDRVGRWVTLLVAGLPMVLLVSVTDLSDIPFAALATGALLVLGRTESEADDRFVMKAAGAGILTGAAFLVRTAALPLVVAGAISLGARRKWRSAMTYVAMWILLATPWVIWQRTYYQQPPIEEAYYSMANYEHWNLVWNFTLAQKAVIVRDNLEGLASAPGLLIGVGPVLVLPVVGYVVTVLALLGWLVDPRRWRSAVWLFLPCYLGIITLWAFPPRRFVIPLMPLVLCYAWRGLQAICRKAAVTEWKVGTVSAMLLCLLLGNGLIRQAWLTSRAGEVYQGDSVREWHQAEALFDWVRNRTPPNSVIVTQWDTALYLFTGRRALRGYNPSVYEMYYARTPVWPLGTISQFARGLLHQKVDYVAVTGNLGSGGESGYFRQLVRQVRARYPEALQDGREIAPYCFVYRVNRAALMAAADGPEP